MSLELRVVGNLVTAGSAYSSRGEIGYEYRVERNRASSTSVLEAARTSGPEKGRNRPALDAGFFIFRGFRLQTDSALRLERRRSDRHLLNGTTIFDN